MNVLCVAADGTLYFRDVSPRGRLAELAFSGHWRLKRGTKVVLDHRGAIRFAEEVYRCANCTLYYDAYEMAKHARKKTYCKKCWNDYHAWRRARLDFQKVTGEKHDVRMYTFRQKYLKGELTVSPPVQWSTENPPDEAT